MAEIIIAITKMSGILFRFPYKAMSTHIKGASKAKQVMAKASHVTRQVKKSQELT